MKSSLLSCVLVCFTISGLAANSPGQKHDPVGPATRFVRDAERLRREWRADSLQAALSKYQQAANYYANRRDARRQADMLVLMGEVSSILSRHQQAIAYYEIALQLSKKEADERDKVDLLNRISEAYLELAKAKESASYCRQAHDISRQLNYARGLAQALNSLGLISLLSGEVLEAQRAFNEALSIWEKEDYPRGRANTLLNLGYLHGNLGNAELSFSFYERARVVAKETDDRRLLAYVLTALGGQYALTGERQRALEFHDQALRLFRAMGDRGGEAVTLNGIGYFYDDLGKGRTALARYRRALELFRAIDNARYAALTLGYIGRVYSVFDKQKALDFYNQKLFTSRRLKDPRLEAYTLRDIGGVLVSLNQHQQAQDCYRKALDLSRRIGDRRGEAYVRAKIAALHENAGERSEALVEYQSAFDLLHEVTDRRGEISTLFNMARIKRDLGRVAEASRDIERSLGLIEGLRSKVASPSLRISFVETVYQHYELYLELLMSLDQKDPGKGYSRRAFEMNEHARARTLLENLRASQVDIRAGVERGLLLRETQLQQQLNQKAEEQMRLLSGKHRAEQREALKTEIDELAAEFEAIESSVREYSPNYAALTQPTRPSLPELQRELDHDTLLIEYALGTDRSFAWAVTTNSVDTFILPGRAEIEAESKRLYDILDTSGSKLNGTQAADAFSPVAVRLSSMLLSPMRSLLTRKRVVIVADGILQYIPFAALAEPQENSSAPPQPLIVNHEVVTLPSLSTLTVLRRQLHDRSRAPKTLAVFADPVFEKDDPRLALALRNNALLGARSQQHMGPALKDRQLRAARDLGRDDGPVTFARLPFSAQEAAAVLAIVPETESKRALGFDASLRTALDRDLQNYRIIHFATHGLLNNSYPELSGVVLSLFNRRGERQDGFLRLNEIYNLNLAADLVVLSACQTGLGKQVRGEGLIGLTRGFMYAGVPRVVASLWRIDDRAAAELMKFFYEALLVDHMTPAAALRAAQIKMWRSPQWRHPRYWAAFVLQGEWN